MKTQTIPAISDYAFISDCHSSALVSKNASIDWCCMPRFDAGACFGKILDAKAGQCAIIHKGESINRSYASDSLILETTFQTKTGSFYVTDFFVICEGGATFPRQQLVRIACCTTGHVEIGFDVQPRFDYGLLSPWIRQEEVDCFTAIGGNDALVLNCDQPITIQNESSLLSKFTLHAGQRAHLSIRYLDPAKLSRANLQRFDYAELEELRNETSKWWQHWSNRLTYNGTDKSSVVKSALVLRGMCYAPSGAIIAAPTTSLPEAIGGNRNWDYRYSWIRDSAFAVRALSDIGFLKEAGNFCDFVQRSAASSANALLIMYGIDGRRRLDEVELHELSGYKNSKPVRYGNAAFQQVQFDCYGLLLQQIWQWHERGKSPNDDLWKFILRLVDYACEHWQEPDQGLWESRGAAEHFVHSKVMLWCAVDRGIKLSNACSRKAPIQRWQRVRKQIKDAIYASGLDKKRHHFVRAFGSEPLDSALLLIPQTGFVDWQDELMIATCEKIMSELDRDGLLMRYKSTSTNDGMVGSEGSFLACTFWLVECLAMQGRIELAQTYYERVMTCANDLGLMSEEFDAKNNQSLGNFPQALSHLSQITAALALQRASTQTQI